MGASFLNMSASEMLKARRQSQNGQAPSLPDGTEARRSSDPSSFSSGNVSSGPTPPPVPPPASYPAPGYTPSDHAADQANQSSIWSRFTGEMKRDLDLLKTKLVD